MIQTDGYLRSTAAEVMGIDVEELYRRHRPRWLALPVPAETLAERVLGSRECMEMLEDADGAVYMRLLASPWGGGGNGVAFFRKGRRAEAKAGIAPQEDLYSSVGAAWSMSAFLKAVECEIDLDERMQALAALLGEKLGREVAYNRRPLYAPYVMAGDFPDADREPENAETCRRIMDAYAEKFPEARTLLDACGVCRADYYSLYFRPAADWEKEKQRPGIWPRKKRRS